jgi:hypothetical protein
VCRPSACRRRPARQPASRPPVRRYSCDLVAIADWLKECGVTTVALESTGISWVPLAELL